VRDRLVLEADAVDLPELGRLVGKGRILADAVNDVDPEAVDSAVEPEPKYPCPLASSSVQAGPPKTARQLFGGPPSRPSRQWYQSRLGDDRDARDSRNHGWRSDVWFGTQSTSTRMPRSCAAAIRR